ncbi:MAG: hypothetical protein AAFW89_12780, partial [Bacteroidota bacterium]
MNLCIGILDLTPAWKAFFEFLGVACMQVNEPEELTVESCSVLIINTRVSPPLGTAIDAYLNNNGAVLEIGSNRHVYHDSTFQKKRIHRVFNTMPDPRLNHIPWVDVYNTLELIVNKNSLFNGLAHLSTAHNDQCTAWLAFDPSELLQQSGFKRKRFPGKKGIHPDEIVSTVSKREVTELMLFILKELHFIRSLPFVKKWSSPVQEPVFGFRVD